MSVEKNNQEIAAKRPESCHTYRWELPGTTSEAGPPKWHQRTRDDKGRVLSLLMSVVLGPENWLIHTAKTTANGIIICIIIKVRQRSWSSSKAGWLINFNDKHPNLTDLLKELEKINIKDFSSYKTLSVISFVYTGSKWSYLESFCTVDL